MVPASNVTDPWHPLYTEQAPTAENSEGAQLTSPAHVELEPAAAPSEEEPPTLTPARNVTDSWHPLYAGHAPAAENSEDTQLPAPAQDQLEPAAAPAEEEPGNLLIFLRCLVALWFVDRFLNSELMFDSYLVNLAVLALCSYALLQCDHLDHRSVMEAVALPMMAWRLRVRVEEQLGQDATANGASRVRTSTALFFAMLRCLGFLWLVPGSAERHALDLIGLVLYALTLGFDKRIVFLIAGARRLSSSVRLAACSSLRVATFGVGASSGSLLDTQLGIVLDDCYCLYGPDDLDLRLLTSR